MIDTDETGEKKLRELSKRYFQKDPAFNDWELDFIGGIYNAPYKWLTSRQKSQVGRIYDKVVLGL